MRWWVPRDLFYPSLLRALSDPCFYPLPFSFATCFPQTSIQQAVAPDEPDAKQDVADTVKALDTDKDGFVSRKEWEAGIMEPAMAKLREDAGNA